MKLTCDSMCKLKDHVKVSYYHYNLWRKKEKKRGRKQSRQRMQEKNEKKKKTVMVLDRMASEIFLSLKFCDLTEKEKIKK